jgi:hypothetical protein
VRALLAPGLPAERDAASVDCGQVPDRPVPDDAVPAGTARGSGSRYVAPVRSGISPIPLVKPAAMHCSAETAALLISVHGDGEPVNTEGMRHRCAFRKVRASQLRFSGIQQASKNRLA